MTEQYSFPVIGTIRSCYPEKFGVPRQPGLVTSDIARLDLLSPYNDPDTLDGFEGVSHIWILFVFHLNKNTSWKPKVRPPRLGGNSKMGVFATRSPVRPSPIGMSPIKLEKIEGSSLILSGVDLVDGTPVIDIKPYVPYTDCITNAKNSFVEEEPKRVNVVFSESAESACKLHTSENLRLLIEQVLSYDPRPQYHKNSGRIYGLKLSNKNVRWCFAAENTIHVIEVLDN